MKKKKKNILVKILKFIGVILLLLSFLLLLVGKKTNALSSYDNFNYRYAVVISNITQNEVISGYHQCTISELLYYDGQEWSNDTSEDLRGFDILIQTVLDVSDGLGISFANVHNGQFYLIKGVIVDDSFRIYSITTIEIYLDKLTTDLYNQGYSIAVSDNSQGNVNGAWQQGYDTASSDILQSYTDSLNSIQSLYNQNLQEKQEEINSLREQLNSQDVQWGSFQSLLATIFLFPIKFFKEGMNVDLFGVNVGGLIIGLALIGIMVAVVGLILGKRGGAN